MTAPAAQLDPVEQARLDCIKAHIPPDVRSLLDCGCGRGWLGNQIKDRYSVLGCDIGPHVLRCCAFPTVQASVASLPFDDARFDLVVCSEVLEHLRPDDYRRACLELQRVSRRWILVTVPYREDLEAARCRCPHCGTVYHNAGHLRRLDKQTLAASFASCSVAQWFFMGPGRRYDLDLRARLRRRLLGYPLMRRGRPCPLCRLAPTPDAATDHLAADPDPVPGTPAFPSARTTSVTDSSSLRASANVCDSPERTNVSDPAAPGGLRRLSRLSRLLLPSRPRWLGCLLRRIPPASRPLLPSQDRP